MLCSLGNSGLELRGSARIPAQQDDEFCASALCVELRELSGKVVEPVGCCALWGTVG